MGAIAPVRPKGKGTPVLSKKTKDAAKIIYLSENLKQTNVYISARSNLCYNAPNPKETSVTFIQILLALQLSFANATEPQLQKEVDRAFGLIFETQIGQTICRDILGADASAIALHLGITRPTAEQFAKSCSGDFEPAEWVYPTAPPDILKIAGGSHSTKQYIVKTTAADFPIESWTDSVTNATTILIPSGKLEAKAKFEYLVQILAHETAVYFDSKINPRHQNANSIPHLRSLSLKGPGIMDPLIAVSNPIVGHTLTYLRALQVELAIIDEIVAKHGRDFTPHPALNDPYLRYLVSESCTHSCIENLILRLKSEYLPIALPMLAFASHYRSIIIPELGRIEPKWDSTEWLKANQTLNYFPVAYAQTYKETVNSQNVVVAMENVFNAPISERAKFDATTQFMSDELWAIEWPVVSQSRFQSSGLTLLEFMKRPLLSGYNILLTSGPRVRVRGGLTE